MRRLVRRNFFVRYRRTTVHVILCAAWRLYRIARSSAAVRVRQSNVSTMEKILVTGAAGGIGTRLRKLLKGVYPSILWSDLRKPDDLAADETFMAADLSDMAQVEKIVAGVDGIVHLGGFSVEGSWDTILQSNIVGTYNMFEAACRAKVKRVVFASSNHAVGFYPRDKRIGINMPVRPDSRYGVSKAFGEAIGAFYADKHGLRVTCLRIGHFLDEPVDQRRLSIWLKPEDLVQLIRIGLEHRDIHYEIFYGVSDNAASFWDNSNAQRYGYHPHGKADDYRAAAMAAQAKLPPDPVGDRFQGGPFCTDEYDADRT
jgi:uronate dehydrogenase